MKMKMHKIPKVDKAVCTVEQKIASNYAFMWRTQLKYIYDSDNMEFVKQDGYQQIINKVTKSCMDDEKISKRYNIDAIIHCFRNGIKKYCQHPNGIFWNYEEIGEIFVCLYEY